MRQLHLHTLTITGCRNVSVASIHQAMEHMVHGLELTAVPMQSPVIEDELRPVYSGFQMVEPLGFVYLRADGEQKLAVVQVASIREDISEKVLEELAEQFDGYLTGQLKSSSGPPDIRA